MLKTHWLMTHGGGDQASITHATFLFGMTTHQHIFHKTQRMIANYGHTSWCEFEHWKMTGRKLSPNTYTNSTNESLLVLKVHGVFLWALLLISILWMGLLSIPIFILLSIRAVRKRHLVLDAWPVVHWYRGYSQGNERPHHLLVPGHTCARQDATRTKIDKLRDTVEGTREYYFNFNRPTVVNNCRVFGPANRLAPKGEECA